MFVVGQKTRGWIEHSHHVRCNYSRLATVAVETVVAVAEVVIDVVVVTVIEFVVDVVVAVDEIVVDIVVVKLVT